MENIFVEFLPPWVETGLQPAFYDKESGTVLQQTARMYDRVNMLIRMFNKLSKETKETVENYIQEFDNLYTYVHDYFDNLDVQEEINNKLDVMAEDGTLATIINELWGTRIDDLDTFKDSFDTTGITTKHNVYSDGDNKTDYWMTYIPRVRTDGKINELKQWLVGLEGQTLHGEVARPASVARNNGFKFCCNSATFIQEAGEEQYKTNNKYLIQDGVQIPTNGDRTNLLCIMDDGTLKHYDASDMTGQDLIDAGVKYSLTAFWTVIEDGLITAEIQSKEDWSNFYQRQVIAQDAEKNIYIFTCDGKPENGGNYSYGMSMQQVANLLLNTYHVTFAFMLDGGGSASTVVDGTVLNQVSDNLNRDERYVPFMLYVEDDRPQSVIDSQNAIGQEIDYLKKEIWDTSYVLRYSKDITADAEAQAPETSINYKLLGSQYTGADLPNNDYKYGVANVTVRTDGNIVLKVNAVTPNRPEIVKYCTSDTWGDWLDLETVDNTAQTITSTYGTPQYIKTRVSGKLASVAFQLNTTGAISDGNTIASGIKGSAISNSAFVVWDNNNGTTYSFAIDTSGNIVSKSSIPSGASLRFNFTYLTQ